MFVVEYSSNGSPVSDFEAERIAGEIMFATEAGESAHVLVSTENVIHVLLKYIARGLLSHNAIHFISQGQDIVVNEYGAIHDWPGHFAQFVYQYSEDKLHAQVNRKRAERSTNV